jgi:glycosyltransferase involved in cell wall biosynthesis
MTVRISAVIPTHNRARYLPLALRSLADQRLAAAEYEIVVVDNLSTDATREIVAGFGLGERLHYVHEPVLGLSHARNAGWREARGSVVAFLDDDAIASPDWLARILDTLETVSPRPGCVGGPIEGIWEAPRPAWLSDELVAGLAVLDWGREPHALADLSKEWLAGANMAFPRDVLEQMGGFVAGLDRVGRRLLSSGDVFMARKIAKAGYACWYDPAIAVGHHVPASRLQQSWFLRRYYAQGLSDAAMDLLEKDRSLAERGRMAAATASRLLRSPRALRRLALPTRGPERFREKCFALIEVGHIAGLLGALGR